MCMYKRLWKCCCYGWLNLDVNVNKQNYPFVDVCDVLVTGQKKTLSSPHLKYPVALDLVITNLPRGFNSVVISVLIMVWAMCTLWSVFPLNFTCQFKENKRYIEYRSYTHFRQYKLLSIHANPFHKCEVFLYKTHAGDKLKFCCKM